MSAVAEAQSKTQAALAQAVQGLQFPTEVMGQAAQLLSRLNQPTRVSLLGLPKSGKTGIFNLLAGQEILPEGLGSTVQLVHGEAPKAHVTLPDGTNLSLDGMPDLERIGAMTPVFVKLEMDLPALQKISLLEVVTNGDRTAQQRAVAWAMKQTDIGIWCTEDFAATEQALWADVPDEIKDHAILLRTRADQLTEDRAKVVDDLKSALEDSFAFFMAVSSQQAKLARSGEVVDKAQMKASGASSLISTILRQIERGRQAAVDQADILLLKHPQAAEDVAAAAPVQEDPTPVAEEKILELKEEASPDVEIEKVEASDREVEAPQPEEVAVAQEETVDAPLDNEVSAAPAEAAPQPAKDGKSDTADDFAFFASARAGASQPTIPMASLFDTSSGQASQTAEAPVDVAEESAAETETGDEVKVLLTSALDRLCDTGQAIATFDPADGKKILRASSKTIEWLQMQLVDADIAESDTIETLMAMTQDASDLLQLLKAEGGDDAGREAVTALLQVKRCVQAELAA